MPSTSGTKVYSLTVDEIIREAKDHVGGDFVSGYEAESAMRTLNLVFADIINRGIPLSSLEQDIVTVAASVTTYSLGVSVEDVFDMVYVQTSTGTALTMKRIGSSEYLRLPKKSQSSRPTQYHVERDLNGSTVFLYPVPDNSVDTLLYYGMQRLDTVTKLTQTIDLPYRYYYAIVYGLAYHMSFKRQVEQNPELRAIMLQERQELKALYEQALMRAFDADEERVSFFATPKLNT